MILRMTNTRIACALLAAAALAVVVHAQGARRDGQWEVTVEMNMPGMPVAMPPRTITHCVTPADAADPQKAVPPQGRGNPNDCKVSDFKADGNKVSWSMKCEGPPPMTGTGEFVYQNDAYTGTVIMNMQGGGGAMTMKYSGKRHGDCAK